VRGNTRLSTSKVLASFATHAPPRENAPREKALARKELALGPSPSAGEKAPAQLSADRRRNEATRRAPPVKRNRGGREGGGARRAFLARRPVRVQTPEHRQPRIRRRETTFRPARAAGGHSRVGETTVAHTRMGGKVARPGNWLEPALPAGRGRRESRPVEALQHEGRFEERRSTMEGSLESGFDSRVGTAAPQTDGGSRVVDGASQFVAAEGSETTALRVGGVARRTMQGELRTRHFL